MEILYSPMRSPNDQKWSLSFLEGQGLICAHSSNFRSESYKRFKFLAIEVFRIGHLCELQSVSRNCFVALENTNITCFFDVIVLTAKQRS